MYYIMSLLFKESRIKVICVPYISSGFFIFHNLYNEC